MENSFFEFRNETADKTVPSSDDEIDDSGAGNASSSLIWKKVPKNQTAYVPESDSGSNSMDVESSDEEQPLKTVKSKPARRQYAVSSSEDDDSDEEQEEDTQPLATKSVVTRSSVISSVELSSDDDTNRHGSVRKQSASSSKNKLESSHRSSSGEEEVSPELIPKRRPQIRDQRKSKDSPMIRRIKKRMLLTDSENDNSIIIEKEKSTKQACLKATPLKIEVNKTTGEFVPRDMSNMTGDDSMVYDDEASNNEISEEDVAKTPSGSMEEGNGDPYDGDDDGPDEDEMVMSRATRMSIMGVVPKDRDSDESDYLQTDESSLQSRDPSVGSTNSLNDLPEIGVGNKTSIACQQPKPDSPIDIPKEQNSTGINDSNISCSSIESLDVSGEMIDPRILSEKKTNLDNVFAAKNVNKSVGNKDVMKAVGVKVEKKEVDADVMIIDHQSEIIALSSDEDDYQPVAAPAKKPARASRSPANKKSPKIETSSTETPPAEGSMKQYLLPPSYPNQGVVYVKRSVRENEMNKLGQLQEDLHNVRHILEHMEVETLPDKGAKLLERFNKLERDVKTQAERVANMRVEPDNPSAQDIANDGFQSKVLSWEELQKASNEVQPRMFGKQAMSTHLAERNLILERLRSLHESLGSRPGEDALHAPPAAVRAELMPHQLHALAWLRWRETQRPPAGILADDMGLGKTITMISLILSSKESKIDDEDDDDDSDDEWRGKENRKLSRGGTLVVCPASLLQQWAGEVEKHCRAHALSVLLHHGNNRSTQANRVATHDLVITTYNLLQRDCEKNGVLFRINWQRVILDEAHIVRNHKSATCGAVSAIRGRRRWCLTGTPVQNKDLDVFALLKFMKCTPFDDLTMWKKWIDNKSLGGQERLSTIMRCLMLRRTKAQLQQRGQLACLPQRQAHQRQVTLTKDEMNVYQKVLVFSKTLFAQFLHQRAEKQADGGFLPKAPGKDDAYAKMHKKMVALQGAKPVKSHEILVLLLRLRQVCCHCGLIAAMLDGSDTAVDEEDQGSVDLLSELKKLTIEDEKTDKNDTLGDDEPTEDVSVADAIRSVLSPNNPVFKLTQPSSKIRGVMECLNTNVFANKGDKAVVVSQWTSVLRLVQQELTAIGVKSVTLSGQVPVPARQGLVQQLNDPNSSTKVMLLSLCAGGVGLNLCGANHLLLLDPHWNPQLEEQAQDRIYRVGQKKDVHIYRFMCVDTVEQSIRQLQQVKLELAESVLTGARPTSAAKLTIDDLKMLFNMGQE